MAAESVTFDFIGRGAGQLADSFKKTGDNASLAAKGARLCADSLDKERTAADASARASLALAKADKVLADAEKELAADSLAADAALKKQQKSSSGLSGLLGRLGGGGQATPDTAGARSAFATLDKQLSQDAANRLRSGSTGSVLGALNAMFSRGAATKALSGGGGVAAAAKVAGGSGGGASAGSLAASTAGGIGPGILGLSAKTTSIVGAVGSALATLPALAGVAGTGVGVALIGGIVGVVSKGAISAVQPAVQAFTALQNAAPGPAQVAALKNYQAALAQLTPAQRGLAVSIEGVQTSWQNFVKSNTAGVGVIIKEGAGLLPGIFAGMSSVFQAVVPQMKSIFANLGGLIAQVFTLIKAAVPAFAPVVNGIIALIANILPGITAVITAMRPFLGQFAGILATLGKNIGSFFAAAAPAIGASMTVLGALLDLVGALLPAIMKIAGAFATALAPVFTTFAGSIKALTPFLTTLGMIIAQLAKAVLGDLSSAFSALGQLLTAIAPSLNTLARALGQMFAVLENSGAFAAFGNALEAIVPALAMFINTLVKQFAPLLPVIIALVGQLASIFATVLAAGLSVIITGVTELMKHMPLLVPILAAVAAATWLWNVALAANPVGVVIIAIVALVGAIAELVIHWKTVWGAIKSVAADVGSYLDKLFHKSVVQDILDIWSLGLLPLAQHWKTVWAAIEGVAGDFWSWLSRTFGTDIANFFTRTIPGWWDEFTGYVSTRLITPWKNIIKGGWNWIVSNVWNPVQTMVTRTLPGWFGSAVSAIGGFWNKVKQIVHDPAAFVVNTILGNLVGGFDTVISWVGLKGPAKPHMASKGWKVPGYGGGDKHLALLEGGESVVPKELSPQIAGWLKAQGVPGHQFGWIGSAWNGITGAAGNIGNFASTLWSKVTDAAGIAAALATGNTTALINDFTKLTGQKIPGSAGAYLTALAMLPKKAIEDVVSWIVGHIGPEAGEAIVKYARSFLGKIPYVWGGTSLDYLGADCSGFVQAIYSHFGIGAPRSSEAQGSWVKKGPPVAGGLAFYHSPPGGADPGHVAIVQDLNTVISQGGGMGPTLMGIRGMPLLFTGSPPGGFGTGAGGTTGGVMSAGQIAALWDQMGGPASAAANMARIAYAESGDNPSIIQQGQPPGLTGWGLYQITPTSGISQNGAFGNLLNAANNTRAAISLFNGSGYGPWSSDPVGAGLVGGGLSYDTGGTLRPGWNLAYNGTGRPEPLIPAGRGGAAPVIFEIAGGGAHGTFDAFLLKWIQEHVRVKGGGSVQTAFGRKH